MNRLFTLLLLFTAFSANCSEQKTRTIITIPSTFSNETLTLLNRMGTNVTSGAVPFYIPHLETVNSLGNPLKPEQVFGKYPMQPRRTFGVSTIPDEFVKFFKLSKEDFIETEAEYWKILFNQNRLKEDEQSPKDAINIKDLPKILEEAKNLLKFFLATDNELSALEKQTNYIKKHGLNRLFTYAKLARIIKDKKLSHVFLAQKSLAIFDKKNNRILSYKDSAEVIGNKLKAYINHAHRIDIDFDNNEKQYEPVIFASKEQNNKRRLNNQALEELTILCHESPFDIGSDNIFSTPEGDAIIIDTEFKGEEVNDCQKIKRYS